MVRIAAIAAWLAALCVTAPAADAVTAQQIGWRWAAAAIDYWGARPACPQGIRWHEMRDGQPVVGRDGYAIVGGCDVWLDAQRFSAPLSEHDGRACFVVVHEWGHLLGFDHDLRDRTVDPMNVMSSTGHDTTAPPQCVPERRRYWRKRDRRWCARHQAKCAVKYPKLHARITGAVG